VVLRLEIGARFNVNASSANGVIGVVDLPADAKVSGGSQSGVTLAFAGMELVLVFGNADGLWDLSNLTLKYGGKMAGLDAADADGVLGIHAHAGNAFKCSTAKDTPIGPDVTATIRELRVQPFMTGSENGFGKAEICEEDKVPNNVVPIAVGAALAALVVLVLIMYLIGRRKHQRGYTTV